MRYIGNKTKLLGFIGDVLDERRVTGGVAVDPFTGTASVARALKRRGFRVVASDLMEYARVFGRAYVEVAEPPELTALGDELGSAAPSLADVVAYLNALEPSPGFIYEHYTPEGDAGARHGRMYFTPENAARVDAVRTTLEHWRNERLVGEEAFHLLLAALIEAADRVANTTGVYASFVKSWQPNALRPLELRVPEIEPGNGCRALGEDALELVGRLEPFELLYLDPPYNARQYPGYYHIPELIARGWFDGGPELRGKAGLIPDADQRSEWASRRHCEDAFEQLIACARCRHIVLSYNDEGLIGEQTIERVLKEYGRAETYGRYTRAYARYRSDSDGENRSYAGDEVEESLYCVTIPEDRRTA